jgi:hypothetical protein
LFSACKGREPSNFKSLRVVVVSQRMLDANGESADVGTIGVESTHRLVREGFRECFNESFDRLLLALRFSFDRNDLSK